MIHMKIRHIANSVGGTLNKKKGLLYKRMGKKSKYKVIMSH